MASIRTRSRRGGITAYSVLYTLDGRQTSVTFDAEDDALKFKTLVDTVGARRAMDAWGIADTPKAVRPSGPTVGDWCQSHVEQLTGVTQKHLDDSNRYVRRDIRPFFGDMPLTAITEEDIAAWVKHLEAIGNKPKTIKNKHGFLSSALGRAVPKHLPANPAAGRRLPQGTGEEEDMRMLTPEEFARLLDATTDYWKPLMEFLVATGARWGEVSALKPSDVDRVNGLVKIRRGWKNSSVGFEIGPVKTKRGRRDVPVSKRVLDMLDYSQEWLFVNRDGGPVRYNGFRRRVWDKAVQRAGLEPKPTPHDLRHTAASWMLNGGIPPGIVSRRLGHESISITVDIYGDVDRVSAQMAADFMDTILAPDVL